MGEPEPRPVEVNPFHLPGWEHSPLRPLCPWIDPEHESYYIPINHTAEAFEEFIEGMGTLRWLVTEGRLVLVVGESGCGKTSLINRCVAWVRQALREEYLRAVILDLTVEARHHSVNERMEVVVKRLLDDLRREKLLDAGQLEELMRRTAQPELFYPYLANELEDDVVLLVLLPPSDLLEEVQRYVGLARRKIVFFAESAYLDESDARRVERHHQARVPPVVLRVGTLRPGDVVRFATDRLNRQRGEHPRMSVETMESAAVPLRSIAMLQRVLSGVFEDRRRRKDRYTSADWVTFTDITEYVYGKFLQEPGISP